MVLFIKPHLDSYRRDPKIKKMLNGVKLLNLQEFFAWYDPPVEFRESRRIAEKAITLKRTRSASRSASNSSRRTRRRRTSYDKHRFIKEGRAIKERSRSDIARIRLNTFKTIASTVCKKIGREYGRYAASRLLDVLEYDFLVAVVPDYDAPTKPMVSTKAEQKRKLQKILGFIIAEKEECKARKYTYSVNLICIRKLGEYAIKGSVLLGCFLHCIKCHVGKFETMVEDELRPDEMAEYGPKPIDQFAVLELAGGYTNTEGFFSYSKLGFKKDLKLHGVNCFKDADNLPMSVDLTAQYDSPEHVIDVVAGIRPISEQALLAADDTGLIRTGFKGNLPATEREEEAQMDIARIANYYYRTQIKMLDPDADKAEFMEMISKYKIELEDGYKTYLDVKEEERNRAYSTDTEQSRISPGL